MKVLKFGGKSLAAGTNFQSVIDIIKTKSQSDKIAVVVSAIGNSTDLLEKLLETASAQQDYTTLIEEFKTNFSHFQVDLSDRFQEIENLLEGIKLVGDYTLKTKDRILAQGELISSQLISHYLKNEGVQAIAADSRQFFVTDSNFGNARADEKSSRQKTQTYFQNLPKDTIPVVTGFIGSTPKGETVTFGRNGSNYSAALLADFLVADELQNFTHVDGIFTANPEWVKEAQKIEELHYEEANELAKFGASILHAQTIFPLLKHQIPLRILNTLNPFGKGTLISAKPTPNGLKSLAVDSQVALVSLEGRGLLGTPGIDGRIFGCLAAHQISVGVISQGSSERGVAFIVHQNDAEKAKKLLETEFKPDFATGDVHKIDYRKDIAVISIIGQDLSNFDKAYAGLARNKIVPILFNNTVTGKNVSLVVRKEQAKKALNVIHGQIFGVDKIINLAIFGHGLVGGTLIDQVVQSAENIAKKKNIKLRVFAIANSKKISFHSRGFTENWRTEIKENPQEYAIEQVIEFAQKHHLENLIAVDNTASASLIDSYIPLIENGFDWVSSNKIANTISYSFYDELRKALKKNHKNYLYETNVGAGLPLIDTINLLHLSGENITQIKGVFSGSLSYIFNEFSEKDKLFSTVLKEASELGYTEPDPREDLSGNDVARKLLVLARELDLQNEFNEIQIENLIPKELRTLETAEFFDHLESIDTTCEKIKADLPDGFVLRYVGQLSGDLQQDKGVLTTELVVVPKNSALGQLTGSDSLFEIYTESYGDRPIIIQGAGAGAAVTARGVFGDILRIAGK